MGPEARTPEEFFADSPHAGELYERVARLVDECGDAEVRVSKSQIAFRRRRGFAYVWRPGLYLRTRVPVVLSIALTRHDDSTRWKDVVRARPNVWMHHLDDEVAGWLLESYEAAG